MWSVEFSVFAAFAGTGFLLEAYFFSSIYGASGRFCNLLNPPPEKKTLPLSDLIPSCVLVAADNYPGCARL